MVLPELSNQSEQGARERAYGCRRQKQSLHVSPENFDCHVLVAPCISGMRQAVASIRTGPECFIPIIGTRLLQVLACSLHQEVLHLLGEGKDRNILHSRQLHIEVIAVVKAIIAIKILHVRGVGSSNSYTKKSCQVHIGQAQNKISTSDIIGAYVEIFLDYCA